MAFTLPSTRCMQQISRSQARKASATHARTARPLPVAASAQQPLLTQAPAPCCRPFRASRASTLQVHATAKTAGSTVKIVIQGRKLQVTDAIKTYVESKLSRTLAPFGQEIKEVDVTLSARGGDTGTHGKKEQKVDVTVFTLRNGVVRVEDSEGTLYASIDIVCDKVGRKMSKVKERAIAKGKWPGRAGPKEDVETADFKAYMQEVAYETAAFSKEQALNEQFAALNRAYPATVRRTKVVELDPISVDEAIEAMEAVGHDFYVFRELETDTVQVVYRRESEGYGVLIPKKRE